MSRKVTHAAAIIEDNHVFEWIKYQDHAEEVEQLTQYDVEYYDNND